MRWIRLKANADLSSLQHYMMSHAACPTKILIVCLQESTRSVSMQSQSQRQNDNGTITYNFDYIIDSTRGTKRVLSTVAIARQKLFIVNGNIKCRSPDCDGSADTVAALQQSLNTFVDT